MERREDEGSFKNIKMIWHEYYNVNTSYLSLYARLVFVIVTPELFPPMLVKV